jgi:hypothetical protein
MAIRRSFVMVLLVVIPSLMAIRTASGRQSGPTPDLGSLADADLKAVTVRLERTACLGSCPAYTVTIHGDGRVEYAGKSHVKVTGARAGRVDPGTIRALVSEFAQAKFLSLPEDYSEEKCACRRCTDMASAITELVAGGATHRVNHYYGCACAPKALFELESAIDKAAGARQWTGDVSKQGPFATTCSGP